MATTSTLALYLATLIAACYAQSGFTFDGTEYKCEGDESCAGITDSQSVESVLCKGFCSCCQSSLTFTCLSDKCHIECEEEDSCTKSEIAMDNVETVSCGEPRSCAYSDFLMQMVEGSSFECSDEEACLFGLYVMYMDPATPDAHMDELQCHGEATCLQSVFVADRLETVSCEGYYACSGSSFEIANPAQDFSLQCEGDGACLDTGFYIVYTSDAPDLNMKSIECESSQACQGTTFLIENNSAGTVVIDELKCEDFQACSYLNFEVTAGSVEINTCICGEADGYGCLCTSGLEDVCSSFEGVWTAPAGTVYECGR